MEINKGGFIVVVVVVDRFTTLHYAVGRIYWYVFVGGDVGGGGDRGTADGLVLKAKCIMHLILTLTNINTTMRKWR
jgi:hypothetical protein